MILVLLCVLRRGGYPSLYRLERSAPGGGFVGRWHLMRVEPTSRGGGQTAREKWARGATILVRPNHPGGFGRTGPGPSWAGLWQLAPPLDVGL